MYSVALDYDADNTVTIAGYAALWMWSRGKVLRFLDRAGIGIAYPDATAARQNQRGQIVIQITDRKRADIEQIIFIDYKELKSSADRKRADNGQKTGRSRVTTTDPNPKPKSKPKNITSADGVEWSVEDLFEAVWKTYPRKDGKKTALKAFKATVKNSEDAARFKAAIGAYYDKLEADNTDPQYIKTGGKFFDNWSDWIPQPPPPKTAQQIKAEKEEQELKERRRYTMKLLDQESETIQ
jgi:hypothetical protein